MKRHISHLPKSFAKTIQQAWMNLAADVLLLAIEDVRQTRDHKKREAAKRWLLSKDAVLFFDLIDIEIDLRTWIEANCPEVEKR